MGQIIPCGRRRLWIFWNPSHWRVPNNWNTLSSATDSQFNPTEHVSVFFPNLPVSIGSKSA